MSKSTISTKLIPDAEAARLYLEGRLWPQGPRCPVCGLGERITTRKGGYYRCNACKLDFTVRTDTVMDRSHLPLDAWLRAMHVLAHDPETPSKTLAAELGCTAKTAHLTRAKIHEAARDIMEANLDLANPEYRIVRGHPGYRVGRDGSVWTRYRIGRGGRMGFAWRRLSPVPDRDGYRTVCLSAPGAARQHGRKISVLVCEAYHGPAQAGQECRHLDGSRDNDHAANLAWGTAKENQGDRRAHGRAPVGEQNGNAVLSDSQIAEILSLKGRMRQADIGAKFGVTQGHVSRVHRGAQRALTH